MKRKFSLNSLLQSNLTLTLIAILFAFVVGGVFLQCDYFAACEEEVEMCEEHWRIRRAMNHDIGEDGFVHVDRPKMAYDEAAVLKEAGFAEVLYCTVGVEGTLLLIAKK